MCEHVFDPGTRESAVNGGSVTMHVGSGVASTRIERAARLYEELVAAHSSCDRETA